MTDALSPELTAFIARHVDSLELLEVLLFLHRYPEVSFTAEAIATELRLQPRSVAGRCASLLKGGLVISNEERFRLHAPQDVESILSELALAWFSHRVRVISTIFSRPAENILLFSDAALPGDGSKDG